MMQDPISIRKREQMWIWIVLTSKSRQVCLKLGFAESTSGQITRQIRNLLHYTHGFNPVLDSVAKAVVASGNPAVNDVLEDQRGVSNCKG